MDSINKRIKKIKNILHIFKKEENGSVLVIVVVMMVSFIVLLALTLDIGTAYLRAGQIQKAADAAVYSAGRMLPVNKDDINKVMEIKDSAISYASLNGFDNLVRDDIELGNIISDNYTDIKVTTRTSVEMNFAKIIGINSINVTRSAKSRLSPTSRTTGAVPLGINQGELETRIPLGDITNVVLKYGSGGGTTGFFGALDLDGTQGGGASDYRLWLSNGYPGETTIGDILHEEEGNMVGATYSGFEGRYNGCTHFGATEGGSGCTHEQFVSTCPRVATVVVYAPDGNKTVIVSGFAAFILESQTETGYITGSFVKTLTSGQGSGSTAGTITDYGVYSLMLSE